jgi:outer membrane protein
MLYRLSLIIICILVCGLPQTVRAEKTAPATIALVDMQRILQESLAAKSVQKQLDAQRSKFQNETESEENELRQAEQDLSKSHDQLTAPVYADKEQQLRQKFLTVEQRVDERRKLLDKSYTDAMNSVRTHLLEIVEAIAKQHGDNIVLIKQQTLWSEPSFDITDEVLKRLNKDMPDVAIPPPDRK